VIFQNVVMVLEPEQAGSDTPARFALRLLLPAVFFDDLAAPATNVPGMTDRLWIPLVLRVGFRSEAGSPAAEIEPEQEITGLNFNLVSLKPIVELLGIQRQPPVQQKADPLLAFYSTGDGLGYNVPVYFDQYLQRYGGRSVIGDPIGEVFPVSGGVYRQCFTNLCLDFDPSAPAGRQLRPAPLGIEYKARFHTQDETNWKVESQAPFQLEVIEDTAYVTPLEGLQIRVSLSQAGLPLSDQNLVLTLTLPDNSQQSFSLPPTDGQGMTSIVLPAVDAPNGTLIPYQVCLDEAEAAVTCVEDHYLIWDYP
jgi:hypothetical protein